MFKNFHKNKQNSGPASTQGGTTLIELLVVIFIFMTITGITIFNYGKFNSSLSIQNLADDIALTVRRAQGYAIGVRGYGDSFNQGYGVHFTTNPLVTGHDYEGSDKSFILFADIAVPGRYNHDNSGDCGTPTSNNECIEILSILSADKIESITLNNNTVVPPRGSVDIMFKRPNPEPTFCYRDNVNNASCNSVGIISSIKIKISNISNSEVFKLITISNNGQISVSNNDN